MTAPHPTDPAPMPGSRLESGVLPESWPAEPLPRIRPVWIPWPIAVLLAPLFWLMPKRFGPHFAAAGGRAAIAAHLVWGLYGAAAVAQTILTAPGYTLVFWLAGRTPEHLGQSLMPVPGLGEILRAPLALLAFAAATASWDDVLAALGAAVLIDGAAVVAMAALLAPYVTAGERLRALAGRSVRLVLWATTSLLVPATAWQVLLVAGAQPQQFNTLLWGLYLAWAVSLVIRGGAGYAGVAEGPAWRQRVPLCEACGYTLTALPVGGACPECGVAIGESLPERRRLPAFAAARRWRSRVAAFWRTWLSALGGQAFYRSVATLGALPAARRFVVWCGAATAAGLAGIDCVYSKLNIPAHIAIGWGWLPEIGAAELATWAALSVVLAIGLLVIIVAALARISLHRAAVAVFFWTAWLLPSALAWQVAALATNWLLRHPLFTYRVEPRFLQLLLGGQARLDLYQAAVVCLLALPLGLSLVVFRRLRKAVQSVRYANA